MRDDQSFETHLNLIRDLEGNLVRVSVTTSIGISGSDWLRLLFFFLHRWITDRRKDKPISIPTDFQDRVVQSCRERNRRY